MSKLSAAFAATAFAQIHILLWLVTVITAISFNAGPIRTPAQSAILLSPAWLQLQASPEALAHSRTNQKPQPRLSSANSGPTSSHGNNAQAAAPSSHAPSAARSLAKEGERAQRSGAEGARGGGISSDGATWHYQWSPQGELTQVTRPDGKTVTFTYDNFGRRTTKTYDGKITEYIWDGDDLIHERTTDNKSGQSSPLTTWIQEPGTFTPLAKIEGRKRYGIVSDHLGSPTLLATEAGRVAWQAQLDIYGVPREEGAAVRPEDKTDNPWRFPGQYEDAETGLYYNRFRYYDPELGRYLSEDPIGLLGGVASFAYVGNSAWYQDPFGLTGTYIFSDGTTSYVGKGDTDRMMQSMRERIGGKGNATSWAHMDFGDDDMGFMVEHRMMEKYNARYAREFANSPNRSSPGKRRYEAADAATRAKVDANANKLDKKFKAGCK